MPNTFLLEFANSIYNWVLKVSLQLFLSFGTSYFGYPVIRNPSISVESTLKSSIVSYLPLGHNSQLKTSRPHFNLLASVPVSDLIPAHKIRRHWTLYAFIYLHLLIT